MTSGIYGLRGSGCNVTRSREASLSLASRLRRRLDSLGSTLFKLTWKDRATPSGRLIYALRASGRPTSDSAFTSWPTPTRDEAGGTPEQFLARKEALNGKCGVSLTALNLVAQLATRATPTTRDYKDGACQEQLANGSVQVNALLGRQVLPASWVSPTACSPNSLRGQGQDPRIRAAQGHAVNLQVRLLDSGETPSGCPASTENRGQLNPGHSRWLMGLRAVWCACAPMATRSSRRSPKNSSAPTKKTDSSRSLADLL